MTTDYPDIPEGWEQVRHRAECGDFFWKESIDAWVCLNALSLVDPSVSTVIRRIKRPCDNACGTICIGTDR